MIKYAVILKLEVIHGVELGDIYHSDMRCVTLKAIPIYIPLIINPILVDAPFS